MSTVDIILTDTSSIKKGCSEIDKFIENLGKLDEVCKRLAEIGLEVANNEFSMAASFSISDDPVDVQLVKIDNGYQIQANGNSVCYLEFGAGVYYNGMGSYPDGETPPGIDGIGEHDTINHSGVSKGIYRTWGFRTDSGQVVITHGNPSAQAMYQARIEMENQAKQIIKEVFGT